MKWGILATGKIAKKFAETILQMEEEGEMLAAVGSRQLESAKAFAEAIILTIVTVLMSSLQAIPM